MADIKNIKFGALTPDKRMTLHNGTVTEVKRTYKVVDGQAVIVWDIGEEAQAGILIEFEMLEDAQYLNLANFGAAEKVGTIDWGDGNVEAYDSTSNSYYHNYLNSGVYTIKLSGCDFTKLYSMQRFTTAGSKLYKMSIFDKVTSINAYSFSSAKYMTELVLPDSLAALSDHMLNYCTGLKSIFIPKGVKTIDSNAFYECTSLEEVDFADGILVQSIGNNAFYRNQSLKSIVIPDSITTIGYSAFYECSALESVHLPSNLESLMYDAFGSCTSLQSIILPASLTYMEDNVFYDCTALLTVYYEGSQAQFDQISKWSENGWLGNSTAKLVCLG